MAEKDRLRLNRAGTIINLTSRQQESSLGQALARTMVNVVDKVGLALHHKSRWTLQETVDSLRGEFTDVDFYDPAPRTSMNPDGGILSVLGKDGERFPILISEVKNQAPTT